MITEKEKKNREKLFKLMREHPDLEVLPMVDEEVVCDDCFSWWMGSWGDAEVRKYITTKERIYFDDDDEETVLEAVKGWEWYENATDEEVTAAFKELPWTEAITVYIGLPNL